MLFDEFIQSVPQHCGFLGISSPRDYHHDEQAYDAQYQVSPHDFVAGMGLRRLAQGLALETSGPLLELGCGTGRLSVGLLKAFDASRILVTDASVAFLELSRQKFLANTLALPHMGILRFEDIALLPNSMFSLIVLRSALHHVDRYAEFIATAAQKLAVGGALMVQEPLFEGLFLMGLLANPLRKASTNARIREDMGLLADTMRFYCRADVDKSLAEDKHAFRLADILAAANQAGLGLRFFPNRSFEDFAGDAPRFDFANFVENYLRFCMNFGPDSVAFFMQQAQDGLRYIVEIAGTDRAPESSGVFVLTRTA